ncbi:outer membrane protein [Vibrio maritimus]|uniref:Outer membrane protein n=1 Tax=Vibrio maritimus TaxID=990268 RepID=A0A090SYK5_9VIBR|nr:outer membrane protein [Vibrio maritimus]
MKKAVVFAVSALVATGASANSTETGFYIGGGYGLTESKLSSRDVSPAPTIDGARSMRVYGGYQFNRVISLEGGYTNYGDLSHELLEEVKIKPSAFSLAANLGYSFDNGLRPFATLGLSRVNMEFKAMGESVDRSATGFRYGLGLEYAPQMVEGLAMRVAYEADAFDASLDGPETYKLSVSSLYLGASYKF